MRSVKYKQLVNEIQPDLSETQNDITRRPWKITLECSDKYGVFRDRVETSEGP